MRNNTFLFIVALMCSITLNAKEKLTVSQDLHLISGNIQFINEQAVVSLQLDFDKAVSVEYGKDDKTIERYEGRWLDSIPAEEWDKDFAELNQRTIDYFNETAAVAGKPVRMTSNAAEAQYDIVFIVDTIDAGNSGAAVFVRHAGCAIGTGNVYIKRHGTDEVVCHLYMDKLKAEWNDIYAVDRLIRLYGWEVMGKYFFNATQYPIPFSTKFKTTIIKDSPSAPNYRFLNPDK